MRRYRTASALFLALGPLLLAGVDVGTFGQYFSFALPYLQDNLLQMMVMAGIFGAVRTIGAIGLWRGRMWGLALSVISCTVTMVLMIFMLPAGIADGLLSCTALMLMLTAYFGGRTIPVQAGQTDASTTPTTGVAGR
jgi:uncharacterized membrane protein (DUF2068 family)